VAPSNSDRAGRRRSTGQAWLLDTNVVSELRKGARCHRGVAAWAETVPPAACYLSRVTIAEIEFGIEQVEDPTFRAELGAWLRDGVLAWFGPRILEVDGRVLLAWRRLMSEGRKSRYTYSQPDALIAATAVVHDVAVVTRNVEDFVRAGVAVINPWGGN
jgi:predicted nucleic acid-binding protein